MFFLTGSISTDAAVAQSCKRIQVIAEQKRDETDRRRRIGVFLHMLEEQEVSMGFESGIFVVLVDKVIIQCDRDMEVCFRNGMKCAYPR